jgi:flagellar basal-body rod protein FlgF
MHLQASNSFERDRRPMQNATYIALSSQMALQRQTDVLANNLANLSTPAFKGEEMLFSQYLIRPPGNGPLAFVQDAGTARNLQQGPITKTGNSLDVALQGNGYLAVQTPLGTRYTRNGHFQLDAQNQVVTGEGYPVLSDSDQPLQMPSNLRDIAIASDGTISVSQSGTSGNVRIGKLQVVDFASPQAVTPAANGLYVTDQTPQPATATVQQGMIEESNVQPVVELTRLLGVQRAFGGINTFLGEESKR